MKKVILAVFCLCSLFPLFAGGAKEEQKSSQVELRFLGMAQAAYSEQNVNDMTADFMKKNPNIRVSTEFVPYEELRNKTLLAYGSNNPYDAVLVDDIWYAEYAAKGMLKDITAEIPTNYKQGVLAGGWNFVTKNSKVYGVPWFLDTMYLFYNKAMLRAAGFNNPPKSLEELATMATAIKTKGVTAFPVVLSLAQAEALICVYANFLEASGGTFQDAKGQWSLETTGGVKALDALVNLKKGGLLNPNSLEYLEEDVRRVFSSGDAAFTLNWGYMYALAKDPAESKVAPADVGVMVLPGASGVKESAAMSGSMGLSVLSKTKYPAEALQYVLHLSSKEVQDTYSNLQLPVWSASYDDPAIRKGREDLVAAAKKAFSIMNVRPSEPNYQQASAILQQNIQRALYGEITSQAALADALKKIRELK